MAPPWPAKGSRWTSGGAGFYFGEASRVGDEVGGQTGRSLGCEVRIAPLGGGPEDGIPSSASHHWDVSSQGMERSLGLRSTTWSATWALGKSRTWSST